MIPALRSAMRCGRPRLTTPSVFLLALVILLPAQIASAGDDPHPKLDPGLREVLDQMTGATTVRVILTAKAATIAPVRAHVLASRNTIAAEHQFVGAVTAEIRTQDIADFEADHTVDHISLDHIVRSTGGEPPGKSAPIDDVMLA